MHRDTPGPIQDKSVTGDKSPDMEHFVTVKMLGLFVDFGYEWVCLWHTVQDERLWYWMSHWYMLPEYLSELHYITSFTELLSTSTHSLTHQNKMWHCLAVNCTGCILIAWWWNDAYWDDEFSIPYTEYLNLKVQRKARKNKRQIITYKPHCGLTDTGIKSWLHITYRSCCSSFEIPMIMVMLQ